MHPERAPAESLLPIVNNATVHSVIAEFSAQPGLLDATFRRIGDVEVQPTLGLQVRNRIQLVARDERERNNMKEIVATVFRFLEVQAQSDSNESQMNGPLPEAPSA